MTHASYHRNVYFIFILTVLLKIFSTWILCTCEECGKAGSVVTTMSSSESTFSGSLSKSQSLLYAFPTHSPGVRSTGDTFPECLPATFCLLSAGSAGNNVWCLHDSPVWHINWSHQPLVALNFVSWIARVLAISPASSCLLGVSGTLSHVPRQTIVQLHLLVGIFPS